MRILLVNKFYYHKGGSEKHFFDLKKLLEDNGHEVVVFSTQDQRNEPSLYEKFFPRVPRFSTLAGCMEYFYSYRAARAFRRVVRLTAPDIIHIHNIARYLSPSILSVASQERIPVVQTVHDYQLVCPNYTLYNGTSQVCTACLTGTLYNAVRNSCSHHSKLHSSLAAVELALNKKMYTRLVARFIAPSKFVRAMLVRGGVDSAKIDILPHFLFEASEDEGVPHAPDTERPYFLYAGRIVEEKGVGFLVALWQHMPEGVRLVVAGEGPYMEELRDSVLKYKLEGRVELKGYVGHAEVRALARGAIAVVAPSIWYEPFSYSVYEAMAWGVPVIASKIGGMQELIIHDVTGTLALPGDRDSWLHALTDAFTRQDKMRAMAAQGKALIEQFGDPQKYYERLMSLYSVLCGEFRARRIHSSA